jgi:predicted dehydrogenase
VADKIRLALVGAGALANKAHYPSLKAMPDVEMAAICDLVPDKLQRTADALGIPKRYTDYRQMLDQEKVDAVYVLMPPYHLFDVSMDVIEHGLHLFIEKPPAVTSFQAESLAQAAACKGVWTMVGFNRRYIPLMRQARQMVESRGPINHCVSVFYKAQPEALYYRGAIDYLHCDAIHAVDALRWMGGNVEEVASVTGHFGWSRENACQAVVKFASGATGVLMTNWATGGRAHIFEMHAQGISAFINPDAEARIYSAEFPQGKVISTSEAAGSQEWHVYYGFYGESRHFIDCLKAGKEPESNFAEAARSMRLVDDLYAAAS